MRSGLSQAFPYGVGNYQKLKASGYYLYVDKTKFIERLELSRILYPFIVRPRRFGKTLFTSMLDCYYDKAEAENFDKNFAGTYIASHKTPEQGAYYVLHFNFAGMSAEHLEKDFVGSLRNSFTNFLTKYPLPGGEELLKEDDLTPASYLSHFFNLLPREMRGRIYVTIDEYDQTANNVLADDPEKFREITRTDGLIKNFYTRLKTAAEDDNIVAKVFITGVTKISLDSLTSGFSIATDISNRKAFADLFGFTEAELRELIRKSIDCRQCGMSEDEILSRMRDYYNGYRFSQEADTSVFNSSMCLYYLDYLRENHKEPLIMWDPAVDSDLSKVTSILKIGNEDFANETVRKVIDGKTVTIGNFAGTLNLNSKKTFDNDDILKFLYYLGYLTTEQGSSSLLVCPNKAVLGQFFTYYFKQIKNFPCSLNADETRDALKKLHQGELQPLLKVVENYLTQGMGLHTYAHFDESNIQTAIHMAVNLTTDYQSQTEKEAIGLGHADVFLSPVWSTADSPYYLLELKYLKKGAAREDLVQKALDEAEAQIRKYLQALSVPANRQLKAFAVVFRGAQLAGLRSLPMLKVDHPDSL